MTLAGLLGLDANVETAAGLESGVTTGNLFLLLRVFRAGEPLVSFLSVVPAIFCDGLDIQRKKEEIMKVYIQKVEEGSKVGRSTDTKNNSYYY